MKIVFLDSYSVGDTSLEAIAKCGELLCFDDTTPEQVVERAADAEVVIVNKVKIMQKEIDQLPKLSLICVAATGTNNVDLQHALERGITVKNVPAYSTQSVAEATFAMTLALLRHVVYYDRYVKDGDYASSGRCFNVTRSISEIKGKQWGVVALGNIGKRVAEIATAFGANVSYYSTSGQNHNDNYPSLSLDELLANSDIISIHAPLNQATQKLITYQQLSLMKPTSILVNVGRGGIICEEGLAKALNDNLIAGAGVDVFEQEPLCADNPLLHIQNPDKLIMAPHCAWSSAQARERLVATIACNISDHYSIIK